MGKMPAQLPGSSKQDYGTPAELLSAVTERFGALTWDVAADANNAVVPERFYSAAGIDALTDDWAARFTPRDLLWLNPPFGGLGHTWAPLVARWRKRLPWLRLLMLSPASIGSEWFERYVHRQALVLAINPRITFVGCSDPYPKDCMLSCYGFGVGFDTWRYDGHPVTLPKARQPANRLVALA